MSNLDDLTDKERMVLGTLKVRGELIGEDEYHMINELIDNTGRGLGFNYRLTHWHTIDRCFNSGYGATYFSQELHDIIEGLVKRGYVIRDTKHPIRIQYFKGLENGN